MTRRLKKPHDNVEIGKPKPGPQTLDSGGQPEPPPPPPPSPPPPGGGGNETGGG